MRNINVFAVALILIGVGAWVVTTNSRVVASTPVGIDPLQMMTGANFYDLTRKSPIVGRHRRPDQGRS